MAVTLPRNPDNSLRAFNVSEIAAMDIRRRGVKNDDHVEYFFGPNGSGCRRKFSCAWDARFDAQIYFVGASAVWFDSGNPQLSRLVPRSDPDYLSWVCTQCDVNPYRFVGGLSSAPDESEPYPVFDRAELMCTFELVPFEVASDEDTSEEINRYVTQPGHAGAETSADVNYISLPGSTLQYTTTGTDAPQGIPIPYGVGFVEPGRKLSAIWRRLPLGAWGPGTTLFDRVFGTGVGRAYLGALNETVLFGRAPLTLQFVGIEEKLLPDATGLGYSWDLRYLFSDKPVPFGHLGLYYHSLTSGAGYYQALRPDIAVGGTITDPTAISDVAAMFIVRNLNDLFVVGDV